jgi:hypothetical protein
MPKLSVALAVSVGALSLFEPALARAHFALNFDPTKTPTMSPSSPQSWWTQQNDGTPQKTPPCGNEGATGTAASGYIMKVQPGANVPVLVRATIGHPGWYRISLKEGASSTQTTTTLPDPATLGAAGSAQQCTPAFVNNPVWSTTQPVLADKLGLPAGSTSTTTMQSGTNTFNVTIPSNANCTMASPCTLQVLMFMTDHTQPTCNYHHCADIAVVSTGTGGIGGAGGSGAGGTGGTGAGGRGGAGGSSAGAGGRGGSAGGSTGSAGTTGSAGASATGSAGTTGTAGAGATGTAGTTGSAGTTGGTGTAGTTGTSGSAGAGATGTAGGTGNTGATGSAGNNGGAGSTGTGTSGAAGTTGTGGDSSGGCRVAGETSGGAAGIGTVILLAALVMRRRRRQRSSS